MTAFALLLTIPVFLLGWILRGWWEKHDEER